MPMAYSTTPATFLQGGQYSKSLIPQASTRSGLKEETNLPDFGHPHIVIRHSCLLGRFLPCIGVL